jgi:hypothetical protein
VVLERSIGNQLCSAARSMGDRSRLALGAELIEGNTLPSQKREELVGRVGAHAVGGFALSAADVPDAQLPRHLNLRPAGRRENVGVGIEDRMILPAERLD